MREADGVFASIVREHGALLSGMARRLCGNEADAADLVHDTYERALRAWGRYAEYGSYHPGRRWLVTILHNLFIDRARKARRTPEVAALDDLEIAAPEPSEPPAWSDVSAAQVGAALATLPAGFRRVYELHTTGWSYDEIAAELRIAKATVGTRLVRARRKLKGALLRACEADHPSRGGASRGGYTS